MASPNWSKKNLGWKGKENSRLHKIRKKLESKKGHVFFGNCTHKNAREQAIQISYFSNHLLAPWITKKLSLKWLVVYSLLLTNPQHIACMIHANEKQNINPTIYKKFKCKNQFKDQKTEEKSMLWIQSWKKRTRENIVMQASGIPRQWKLQKSIFSNRWGNISIKSELYCVILSINSVSFSWVLTQFHITNMVWFLPTIRSTSQILLKKSYFWWSGTLGIWTKERTSMCHEKNYWFLWNMAEWANLNKNVALQFLSLKAYSTKKVFYMMKN